MSPALTMLGGVFMLAVVLGLLARRRRVMTLTEWSVARHGFGALFVFLLMAGEIYTTFSFLGASGWVYGRGAPAFYILCYATLAYTMSYFLLPVIWCYATEHQLVSQADFFTAKYHSAALGILVAGVGVFALLPYLVLQLKGLGIIVSEASYGTIAPATAVWASTIGLVGYVVASGVRGSAWTAAAKDLLVLAVAVALGIYLPRHYYGGHRAMFEAIDRARPGLLTLPTNGRSAWWFVSTVMLNALGFYMWPQNFASTYTARDAAVFRKNAVVLPLYQLILLFVFFTGFAAILRVPGLTGTAVDLSLLRISKQTFGPWMVGLIGGAGLLTALVPGSMLLLSAATILAQNIYRPLRGGATDRSVALLARSLVPVIAVVAVVVTLREDQTIVGLLLTGYNVVAQLFPALLVSLPRVPLATPAGAFCGVLAGELTVGYLTLRGASLTHLLPGAPDAVKDLNEGLVALGVNVVVLAVASLVTRHRRAFR